MVPFTLIEATELDGDRVFVEWETIADDGNRLVEGDYFELDGTTLEAAVEAFMEVKKGERLEINARPLPDVSEPGERGKISKAAKGRIQKKLDGLTE